MVVLALAVACSSPASRVASQRQHLVQFDVHRDVGAANSEAMLADSGPSVTIPAGLTPADVMSVQITPWVGFANNTTRTTFDAQLAKAKDAAKRYARADAAQQDGYMLASYFLPGFGTHWINWTYVNKPFDPAHPAMLLYDGDGTDAHLVAVSYYVRSENGPPNGFAGANDRWHRHFGTCYAGGFLIGEQVLTADDCAKRCDARADGVISAPVGTPAEVAPMQHYLATHPEPEDLPPFCHLVPASDLWMLHAWVVKGYANPGGLFTTRNPKVDACRGLCRPSD